MKNSKRFLVLMLAFALVVPCIALANGNGEWQAKISSNTIVYKVPWNGKADMIFGQLEAGTCVTVICETNDWYCIKWGDGSGFLRKSVWSDENNSENNSESNSENNSESNSEYPKKGTIDPGKKVWLRAEPSKGGKKYEVWYEETEVNILADKVYNEEENEWYYPVEYEISNGAFVTAYITAKYISLLN